MDDWLLLVDGTLVEDDVACVPQDAVTVTVTVSLGQLLQSCTRGTAAASPNREVKITLEYILSKKRRPLVQKECVKDSECKDSDYRNQES